jgi:hypothetical protein
LLEVDVHFAEPRDAQVDVGANLLASEQFEYRPLSAGAVDAKLPEGSEPTAAPVSSPLPRLASPDCVGPSPERLTDWSDMKFAPTFAARYQCASSAADAIAGPTSSKAASSADSILCVMASFLRHCCKIDGGSLPSAE